METVDDFAKFVSIRLKKLGFSDPPVETLREIFRVVYAASLIREEGRFTQGSVTISDPESPPFVPPLRRANYPSFHLLGKNAAFTSEAFAKLSRAVDRWSGSVAVWKTGPNGLRMWGIVDQLVGTNVLLHHEDDHGFANPGILVINVDGPGELTAYHRNTFLGAFVAQQIVRCESDGLSSEALQERLALPLASYAVAISKVLRSEVPAFRAEFQPEDIFSSLLRNWTRTVSRICIGLRKAGTGGTLIFSPNPRMDLLSIGEGFAYERLASAFALSVQDELYHLALWEDSQERGSRTYEERMEISLAETDSEDRERENRACVKLVASLASVDGAILLRPDLSMLGFGVKINASETIPNVYEGQSYLDDPRTANLVDTSRFGTRHSSILKYCVADREAFGVVISQDGQVRVIMNVAGDVLLWDRVKLLAHQSFSDQNFKRFVKNRSRNTRPRRLGYTDTPKTISELIAAGFDDAG